MIKLSNIPNISALFLCLGFLSACVTQTVTPLEEGVVQIDVSAAPVHGRAGAQDFAIKKAAQTTLDYGYDKFVVLGNNAWNEQTLH